jgi:hypothetical protein
VITLLGMTGTVVDVNSACVVGPGYNGTLPCQPWRKGLETQEKYSNALNDLLICVEMFLYSVVHHSVFSHREYETDDYLSQNLTFRESLSHLLSFRDVADDVNDGIKHLTAQTINTVKGGGGSSRAGGGTSSQPLLAPPSPRKDPGYGS